MSKKQDNVIEYVVAGDGIEDISDNYAEAKTFLDELPFEQQIGVQFYEKIWEFDGRDYQEGDVKIFKNYGEIEVL